MKCSIPTKPKTKFCILYLLIGILTFTFSISNTFAKQTFSKHILIFGDSLSAAYGMDLDKGWVQLLANDLPDYQFTNASISGETTIGGLERLPLTLEQVKPDIVFIELGANDGLNGFPSVGIKNNLIEMIDLVENTGAQVLLAGMSLPPNHGPRYIKQFELIFEEVAEERQLPMIKFYRSDFFETPGLIQQDGLHPTESAQPLIRDYMLQFIKQTEVLN